MAIRTQILSLTLSPLTSMLCTWNAQTISYRCIDKEEGFMTDADTDANSGTRPVRQPLVVGELHEETALAYGRASD